MWVTKGPPHLFLVNISGKIMFTHILEKRMFTFFTVSPLYDGIVNMQPFQRSLIPLFWTSDDKPNIKQYIQVTSIA